MGEGIGEQEMEELVTVNTLYWMNWMMKAKTLKSYK